jgi:hypothetical protein
MTPFLYQRKGEEIKEGLVAPSSKYSQNKNNIILTIINVWTKLSISEYSIA